ncbi:hypothetical protein ACJ41P_20885 [Azospirillum argentinense]|uniref:Uncharacterized protein n=1 Tax=Azospirillum argentinense TaxID=2970906 RepID=A0ABW8VBY8_9PROT
MAHSPLPTASLLYQRIDAFQALRTRIDRAFSTGQITPQMRRELLAAARDRSGIATGNLPSGSRPRALIGAPKP